MGQIKNIKLHIVTDIKRTHYLIMAQMMEGQNVQPVETVSNFFQVDKLPTNSRDIFQYNVSFHPEVESHQLKSSLLHDLDDVIGKARCFDGTTMVLPIKLSEDPLTTTVTSKQGDDYTIKIMLTDTLAEDSPSRVQLMNDLLRNQLSAMGMQLQARTHVEAQ